MTWLGYREVACRPAALNCCRCLRTCTQHLLSCIVCHKGQHQYGACRSRPLKTFKDSNHPSMGVHHLVAWHRTHNTSSLTAP